MLSNKTKKEIRVYPRETLEYLWEIYCESAEQLEKQAENSPVDKDNLLAMAHHNWEIAGTLNRLFSEM